MIRRSVRIQLIAFMMITVLGIAYAGFQYVGLGNKIIYKPFTVTALFPTTGNVYPNAEVTEHGVQVGKVSGLELKPDHVEVKLAIDHKYRNKIPANAKAVIANLSAVGEIYVDLQPASDSGPYLEDGTVIPMSQGEIPLDNATLLLNLDKFVNSVDRKNLAIVIDEMNTAFAGTGPDLTRLIERGNSLSRAMQAALPQTVRLIDDGKTVLDTQRLVAGDLRSFASDLAKLSGSIRQDDPDYRRLLDNGVKSAKELNTLLVDNESALKVLLANLVTTSAIQAVPVRLDGLRTILTIYPSTVYNGFRAAPGDGKAHFGIVSDQDPPNCATQSGADKFAPGYIGPGFGGANPDESKGEKPGFQTDGSGNDPLPLLAKLNADCLLPKDSATDVRGARNAPRPPGDNTGDPSSWQAEYGPKGLQADGTPWHPYGGSSSAASSSSSQSSSGAPQANASTTYDPVTDLLLAPDGQSYLVGSDGGQSAYFGANAWKWLLVAPTVG